ncbi:MAG: serine hydroxymethyltransferase, partial [Acidobacteriota bacterium]
DPALTGPITHSIFPVLAATHQVNRVAALAVATAEMIEFGQTYMAQIVRNAQALGAALEKRGIPVLGSRKGYTRTHQVIADARAFGGGLDVAHLLARANLVTNKNLIPSDTPAAWDRPGGLRMGTIEVTRYGMHEKEMDVIAGFMARVLIEKQSPATVGEDVIEFRQGYQTLYYNFDHALPPQ